MEKTIRVFMTVLVVVLLVNLWSPIVSVVQAGNSLGNAIERNILEGNYRP